MDDNEIEPTVEPTVENTAETNNAESNSETPPVDPPKEDPKPQVWEASFPPNVPPRPFRVKNGVFEVVNGVGIFVLPVKHKFTKGGQVSFSDLAGLAGLEEDKAYYVQNVEDESFKVSTDSEGKELVYIDEGDGIISQKTGKINAPLKTCLQMLSVKRWTPKQTAPKVKDPEDNTKEIDDPNWVPKKYYHWRSGVKIKKGMKPFHTSEPYQPMDPFQPIWYSLPKGIKPKVEEAPKEPINPPTVEPSEETPNE